eukprot:1216938-Rhodomonas_salina.1
MDPRLAGETGRLLPDAKADVVRQYGHSPAHKIFQASLSSRHLTVGCSSQILNMRGRSVFQIGMTRLGQNERSQFWGDVEESKTWYLFIGECLLELGPSLIMVLTSAA